MLGAITGDIIGSVYEKRNLKRKEFTPFFDPQSRFTDDTACVVAVADALVQGRSPVESRCRTGDAGTSMWEAGASAGGR